jgi:hypothetical protein
MLKSGRLGASKHNRKEKALATKTTTMGKGGDIHSRELLPQGGHRAPRSQEQIAAAALSRLGFADIDEDGELSSLGALVLEEFIEAVLNSNTEEIDAVESLDCVLS